MTTQKDINSVAKIMLKEYGADAAKRCQAKIEVYKEKVSRLPRNFKELNERESNNIMLEFFNSVYLKLKTEP